MTGNLGLALPLPLRGPRTSPGGHPSAFPSPFGLALDSQVPGGPARASPHGFSRGPEKPRSSLVLLVLGQELGMG